MKQQLINGYNDSILCMSRRIAWLTKHGDHFDSVGVRWSLMGDNHVDFDFPNREQTLAIIQAFPGKWEKSTDEGRMDYTLSFKVPVYDSITRIRIYSGTPPPSCTIEETEEEVPAQPATTRTVRRIVCHSNEQTTPIPVEEAPL